MAAAPERLRAAAPAGVRGRGAAEALRLAIVLAAGAFTMSPFLHDGVLGGEDARWYASVVADNLEQWRAGDGPAFVGQTRFEPTGTVLPLRVAPYLQHLTVALDAATGRRLSPFLLLNLAVFLSGVGAGLSAYLCLGAVLPAQRTVALLLALLYLWCPSVMGIAFYGQMYMSVMALPFLPLAFLGVARIFERDSFSGWAMVSAGCAGCWLAHSPIGLWVSAAAAIALAARWAMGLGWTRRDLARAAGAALLFLGLCGYVFVSVHELDAPRARPIARADVVGTLAAAFPRSLLPVTPTAGNLSDLQLGWSLWAALLLGIAGAWWTRSRAARALAVAGLVLLCLCVPVPGVTRALWHLVPQAAVTATNAVAMQRLYPILAACSVATAACALSPAGRLRAPALAALLVACAWSGEQMLPFRHRGEAIANSRAASDDAMSADNKRVTRFSLGMLSDENRFYSEAVHDPELEQRVLGADQRTYLVSNVSAAAPGFDFLPRGPRPRLALALAGASPPGERQWVTLSPKLTLAPGGHYLLAFDFLDLDYRGLIQITGPSFYRECPLPSSGGDFAFGSGKSGSRVVPLSTAARKAPLELSLFFVNQDPAADLSKYATFARYALIPYDPAQLPLRLVSLYPYVARVASPAAGWYEPFRYYCPGWTATVDGRPAEVRRSWNGLLAVAVPAGESEVRLAYKPALALVASYGLAWVTWFAMAAVFAWKCTPRRPPRAAEPP